jgi:Zn-dependent protease/predicted transcriptional regulator
MKWSFKAGSILGIEFRIHYTFFILLLFVYIAGMRKGATLAINGVLFVCAVFMCVLIHEVGHSILARKYGKETKSITLLPIGGVATIEEMPEKPLQEVVMSAVGPFINLAIAGILYLFSGQWSGFHPPGIYPATGGEFLESLIVINIFLAIFNLLPAFPMDGGRILRGFLSLCYSTVKATSIAVFVGQTFALLFVFYGIFFNFWLAIIGIFLYLGAGSEKQQLQIVNLLHNIPISAIMSVNYQTLSPDEPLKKALEKIYHGCQDDFPVIDKGDIKGILNQESIIAAIHEKGVDLSVADVMDKDFISTDPGKPLAQIYKKLSSENKSSIAVIEKNSLKGMLSLSGISRYFMIQSALSEKKD